MRVCVLFVYAYNVCVFFFFVCVLCVCVYIHIVCVDKCFFTLLYLETEGVCIGTLSK